MGIRQHVVIYNDIAAATGSWIRLDSRYEDMSNRTITVNLTSTDTIKIQGTTFDVRGQAGDVTATQIGTNDIVDITTISASGAYTLNGPWTFIRAVKTGTTAIAKVEGFI